MADIQKAQFNTITSRMQRPDWRIKDSADKQERDHPSHHGHSEDHLVLHEEELEVKDPDSPEDDDGHLNLKV